MLNEEKIALLNVGDELYVGVIYKQRILYRHAKFLSYDPCLLYTSDAADASRV